jgi:hypothetical protein
MTDDFAALLSTVIPIAALALGIEVRSLTGRLVELVGKLRETMNEEGSFRDNISRVIDAFYGTFILCLLLVFLAAAETRVLYMAGGFAYEDAPTLLTLIAFGLVLAFLAPAFEAVTRFLFAVKPSLASSGRSTFHTLICTVIGFAVSFGSLTRLLFAFS